MHGNGPSSDGEGGFTGHAPDSRPILAGIQVREEDLEPQKALDIASMLFRTAAAVILVLALGQFAAWWINRPPGGRVLAAPATSPSAAAHGRPRAGAEAAGTLR